MSTVSSTGSKGMSTDLQAALASGAIEAVARVAAEGLGHAHDHVSWLGHSVVDRHVAQHAAHQPVVGVAAAEGFLEQLDAQRFDFVDVPGAGAPG